MAPDVARLVREERLLEAAELAMALGDPASASAIFERACDFRRAADAALRVRDWARALSLALEAKDDAIASAAFSEVVVDRALASKVAHQLERRGDHAWSARLLEALGSARDAARAYERGGDAVAAARLYEAAGDVTMAAKALEAHLRREPGSGAVRVALGSLLHRYGKDDAAIRTLQRVPSGADERRAALVLLVPALARAGLTEARLEAASELAALGGGHADAEESPALSLRARIFGRYEIVREVASSPHARVVECIDGVRNETVALKIFVGHAARGAGRDALARFEREVRVLASLDHPNIVPLREYLPEGPALVLEWMRGGTLEQMASREPLSPARAVEIARAILSALGEAHRLGIVHRDIKPANVLFDAAGVTRLGDFGVAHLSDLSTTATAGVIGTLGYMSPEQREGRPATLRSDLFGVGALLWEMLTGERPEPVARGVLGDGAPARPSGSGDAVRPSRVFRELDARHDAVVLSLLADEPSDRPEDAHAARRALDSLRWPDVVERTTIPRSERPKPSERPKGIRLATRDDGELVDQWLGRPVISVPLDPPSLARASAFARADHPALQIVLRVDGEERAIWLAVPRGTPLSARLDGRRAAQLREALDRLHALGMVHGAIDAAHVFVDDEGGTTLAFAPSAAASATYDLDRLALARLSKL